MPKKNSSNSRKFQDRPEDDVFGGQNSVGISKVSRSSSSPLKSERYNRKQVLNQGESKSSIKSSGKNSSNSLTKISLVNSTLPSLNNSLNNFGNSNRSNTNLEDDVHFNGSDTRTVLETVNGLNFDIVIVDQKNKKRKSKSFGDADRKFRYFDVF